MYAIHVNFLLLFKFTVCTVCTVCVGGSNPYVPSRCVGVCSGAFAGVVTIDKLKKEYKKTVPGGMQLQELWELLSSHMQTLMEANSAHLDYISK